MSTPVGHSLAGLAVYQVVQKPCALPHGWAGFGLAMLMANLPDLDVIGMILWPGLVAHRGGSHSLFTVLSAGLLLALIIRIRAGLWPVARAWLGLSLVGVSHLLLDWLMACGPKVMFFWPWSEQGYLSSVQLVPTAFYARSLRGLIGLLFHPASRQAMLLELAIFLPLLLAAWSMRRKGAKALPWALLFLCVSIFGVQRTYFLYN